MDMEKGSVDLQTSTTNAEAMRELEALLPSEGIVVSERKVMDISEDLDPDPNNLTGYMRHVVVDPETGQGSADIIEGYAKHHARVRQAEERETGATSPTNYDEAIRVGERNVYGQFRFAIDALANESKFELLLAESLDADTRSALIAAYKAWAIAHQGELQAMPADATHKIIFMDFPIDGSAPSETKWYPEVSKLWRDGQFDDGYLQKLIT